MSESERIQDKYRDRAENSLFQKLYAPFSVYNIYHLAQLEKLIGYALRQSSMLPLDTRRILDVGCGDGGHLLRLLIHGAKPQNLYGIDLMPERIDSLNQRHQQINTITGSAATLPYEDGMFDIVTQYTVFSSILDETMRQAIAQEMQRVVRPGGVMLWYDSRRGQRDDLISFKPQDVQALFPELILKYRKPVRLYFGLSRRLVGISWELTALLERIPALCDMDFMLFQR